MPEILDINTHRPTVDKNSTPVRRTSSRRLMGANLATSSMGKRVGTLAQLGVKMRVQAYDK